MRQWQGLYSLEGMLAGAIQNGHDARQVLVAADSPQKRMATLIDAGDNERERKNSMPKSRKPIAIYMISTVEWVTASLSHVLSRVRGRGTQPMSTL